MSTYMIYTDGSCDLGCGVGAWAFIIYRQDGSSWSAVDKGAKGKEDTTNNEMELYAVVKGLDKLQKRGGINSSSVLVCSDSQWLVKCLTDPSWNCKSHGTLFRRIRWYMKNFDIRFKWVKAHARDARNNAVDALAKNTMVRLREKLYG